MPLFTLFLWLRLRRLLREPALELRALPQQWLTTTLECAAAPLQTGDDVLRRSGGGPYAITAILLAEAHAPHKARLHSRDESAEHRWVGS